MRHGNLRLKDAHLTQHVQGFEMTFKAAFKASTEGLCHVLCNLCGAFRPDIARVGTVNWLQAQLSLFENYI